MLLHRDVICIPLARARSFRIPELLSARILCVGEKQIALPSGRQRLASNSSAEEAEADGSVRGRERRERRPARCCSNNVIRKITTGGTK